MLLLLQLCQLQVGFAIVDPNNDFHDRSIAATALAFLVGSL